MKGKEKKKESKKEKMSETTPKKVSDYQKDKTRKSDISINITPKK